MPAEAKFGSYSVLTLRSLSSDWDQRIRSFASENKKLWAVGALLLDAESYRFQIFTTKTICKFRTNTSSRQ